MCFSPALLLARPQQVPGCSHVKPQLLFGAVIANFNSHSNLSLFVLLTVTSAKSVDKTATNELPAPTPIETFISTLNPPPSNPLAARNSANTVSVISNAGFVSFLWYGKPNAANVVGALV